MGKLTGIITVTNREKGIKALVGAKPLSLHKMADKSLIAHQLDALFEAGAERVLIISETDKGIKKELEKRNGGKEIVFVPSGRYGAPEFLALYLPSLLKQDGIIMLLSENACTDAKTLIKMEENRRELYADMTVLLNDTEAPAEPVFALSALCKIEGIFEPPSVNYSYSDFTYGGAAVFSSSVLCGLSVKGSQSFECDILPSVLQRASVFGYIPEQKILKINTVADYREAVRLFNEKAGNATDLQISESAAVGKDCTLNASVICDGATVGDGCKITKSVILYDAELGKNVTVKENSVIGFGAEIADGTVIEKNTVVPDHKAVGKANGKEVDGKEAFELGKKLGRSSDAVAVGFFGGEENESLAALFADGVAFSGAEAVITGNTPESMWRFAANRFGAESGAFFYGGVKLCGLCGADSLPSLERKTEEKTGKKTVLGGLERLYCEELSRFSEKGFAANISCESETVKKALCGRVISCTEDEYISFFINEGGTAFSLTDERGVYLSEEQTLALSVFSALIADKTLYLPEGSLVADKIFERATGGKIVRVLPDDRELQRKAILFLDAAFCISRIAKAVKITKKPLFELVSAVPSQFTKTVTLPLSQSRRSLARLFKTEAASENGASVPPCFQTKRGGVFAKTSPFCPEMQITAVAESEEQCDTILRELCI